METQRMKSRPRGWPIFACLCVAWMAARCAAQPEILDKKTLLEKLPLPQSLNLEDLFKKMDKQTLDTLASALKERFTPGEIALLNRRDLIDAAMKHLSPERAKQLKDISPENFAELKRHIQSNREDNALR